MALSHIIDDLRQSGGGTAVLLQHVEGNGEIPFLARSGLPLLLRESPEKAVEIARFLLAAAEWRRDEVLTRQQRREAFLAGRPGLEGQDVH
jgi:hypothetical protein